MFYLKVLKNKPFENGLESPLLRHDFIVDVDGERFVSFAQYETLIGKPNASVSLGVIRNGVATKVLMPTSVGLGASLVEVSDDRSYAELLKESAEKSYEELISTSLQEERIRTEAETPKRVKHVVMYYIVLGVVVFLFNADVLGIPPGRYRGLGAFLLIAFLFPILYLIFGKKIFK